MHDRSWFDVLVASPDLAFVLDGIAQLDRGLTVAVGHADMLAAHGFAAMRTCSELRQVLEESLLGTRRLREQVLLFIGTDVDRCLELVLRERTAALLMRLADLALAEHEVLGYARALYTGRFQRLVDVSTYLIARVGELNESWFTARIDLDTWATDVEREAATDRFRLVLKHAERGFAAIGRDPDVGRFLRVGARVPSVPFRLACRVLATLLELPLDLRPPEAAS